MPDGSPETIAARAGGKATIYAAGEAKPEAADIHQLDDTILSPATPFDSARVYIFLHHMAGTRRTLHHQNAAFYIWQTSHYVELSTEEMRANLYRFLDKAKRLEKQIAVDFAPNKTKVGNVLESVSAAAQLPATICPPAWLDQGEHPDAAALIACSNGLLYLPTMKLHPLTPAFFSLNALDFAYDPVAAAPTEWLQFLATIWPDDPQSIEALQELFGLLLTADTRYQKAFLIVGPKRSGKGTIARVLTQLLGAANVCAPTLSSVVTNFGLAPLIGKRLALIADARLSGKADQSIITERLLSITGEDGQTIDRKNRDAWFGKLDVRFVIMTNELPKLNDSSGALAGRFIVLKMTRSFYGEEDLGLGAKLSKELPGILLWAIEGWRRLTARGYFITPASAAGAQEELEELGSPIGAFVRQCCVVLPGRRVLPGELYEAWCSWCREQGRDHPGTLQTFGRDLSAAEPGIVLKQHRAADGRVRYYEGVDLSTDFKPRPMAEPPRWATE